MAKFIIKDLVTTEVENFGKKSPRFIDTLGFINSLGARINKDMASVLTTINFIERCKKAKLSDKVRAYESVLQELINVCADLSTHGSFASSLLCNLAMNLDETMQDFKDSNASSLQSFVLNRRARFTKGDNK